MKFEFVCLCDGGVMIAYGVSFGKYSKIPLSFVLPSHPTRVLHYGLARV